jgi:DNA-binding protein YbaB
MAKQFPRKIRDLDFSKLRGSQMYVLAEFMGCLRQVRQLKGAGPRKELLKQVCLDNEQRAQEGYEIVVLGQTPVGAASNAVPPDQEKRFVEVLTHVIDEHKETLSDTASAAVAEATAQVRKTLEVYAKEQVREAAEKRAPIVIKEGSKKRVVKGVMPPEFKRICELASARIPVMLVGPAGCGKTFLSEKVAEALGLDFSDVSCSEGLSESTFTGRLLPIGKGGAFEHVSCPWIDRYEKGGVMLLDEIDAGDPNLFTYMNKAVANKSYTIDVRYKKPVVTKHADFTLIAAANTFGAGADAMYVGRNQLDAATLDRFKVGMVYMDYSHDVESSLAPADLCSWAWTIREKIYASKLRRIMSTRVIENLATMTARYNWTQPEWEQAYFTGWTPAERNLVRV